MKRNHPFKVSVVTTAYNSEAFIESTIDAVLSQNIEGGIEYVISDDASQDGTVELIKRIIKEHPRGAAIKLIERKENAGVMRNFFGAVLQSKGEYIAFCDSDDVWKDPKKLSKQVSYLEKNRECIMTFHGYLNKVTEDLGQKGLKYFEEPVNQVIRKPQTSTMMVRGILREFVDINVVNEAQGPQNDQYLRFLLQDKGYFKLLNHIEPNVRMVRESSIFSTVNKLTKRQKALHSWQTFYKYHGEGKYEKYLNRKVQGFTSAVKWLEYNEQKEPQLFWAVMSYDFRTGVFIRRLRADLKGIFFKPLVYLKRYFLENQ